MMKKLISMILVLAMALSLCACGNVTNENSITEDPVHEVDGSADIVGSDTESNKPLKKSAWSERIPGEYRDALSDKSFVLNDNGTCTIEGGDYTWKLADFDETYANVDVFDGKKVVYQVRLYPQVSEGAKSLSMGTQSTLNAQNSFILGILDEVDEEGCANSIRAQFFNMEDFHVIELTTDNWLDYFEYVEQCNFYYDEAAGEERAYFLTSYQLKEEYRNVFLYLSRGVKVHYKRVFFDRMITVDAENQTYQWGDIIETRENDYTDSAPIGYSSFEGSNEIYGFFVDSFTVEHFPEDEISFTEFEIARFSGTIYSFRSK